MNNLTRDRAKALILRFFEGKIYPALVCALALISSILGIEVFILPVTAVLFFLAAAFCDSARPLVITFITFCLHVSKNHSPSHTVSAIYGDGNTDYYFTEWRLPVSMLVIALIVGGSVFFFLKNKCYKRISLRRDFVLLSSLVLSLSFLLGGAFTRWYADGLTISFAQICVYLLFYSLFAYGFPKSESSENLIGYFSYISALTSCVMNLQLLHLFLTSDIIFSDGGINKEGVMLGWGIWTLIGISLAVLIPAIFCGAMKGGRTGYIYFAVATLTLLFALLSMSRGAQLISIVVYLSCVLIAALRSKSRLFYRIVLAMILTSIAALAIAFFDRLTTAFVAFFDDNGRVEHAKIAIGNFLYSPIFGVGFAGFEGINSLPEGLSPMGPLPAMAHSTPLQLLSATGAFGFLSYLLYRVACTIPVLKKRTLSGTLAFMSSAVIFLGGLIDNFPFDIYPAFYSLIALLISHKACE